MVLVVFYVYLGWSTKINKIKIDKQGDCKDLISIVTDRREERDCTSKLRKAAKEVMYPN